MEEDATLRRTLLGYIENGHRSFLIDFSAVDYFDSFGLGTWVAINLWGCMMGNDSVRQIAKELRRRSEKLDRSTLAQTAERVKDFDEKMQLTKELKDSEMNFFVFFNTIKDFLFVLDEKGRILQVNQAVLTRLEYSMEELTGQSVLQVHPEGERAAAGRIVAEMLAGEADSCLIPLISKIGELIAVETRIVAGNWNGLPALYGVSKDISALKISEEKLTRTFQETSALLCVSTLDEGIYLDVNAAILHTLGFEREEVIGKKSQDLHIFLQESIRSEILQQILEYSSVRNREIQLRSRNGGTIFGLFSAEIVNVDAWSWYRSQM